MQAFDITKQTGDELPLDRNRRGEARVQVSNRLGRPVSTTFEIEAAGEPAAALEWLSIEPTTHTFATGGSKIVRVAAELPADSQPGRYGFRVRVVPQADDQAAASAPAESAPASAADDAPTGDSGAERGPVAAVTSEVLWIRAGSQRSSRMALVAIAVGLAAVLGVGGYSLLLTPPACDTARAVYDDDASACVCPTGMVEAKLDGRATCVCAAGSAYDDDQGTCVVRACTTERALYSELIAACSCPAGTVEATRSDGSKRCACEVGQRFDESSRQCRPAPCEDQLIDSVYDDVAGSCVCPELATQVAADEHGKARCECQEGHLFYPPEHRCARMPDLAITKFSVFPPLIQQRMFSTVITVKNLGEIPAGKFRLHLTITGSGIDATHEKEYDRLAPGEAILYEPTRTRTNDDSEVSMTAYVTPLDFVDGDESNNRGSQVFDVAYSRKQPDRPSE